MIRLSRKVLCLDWDARSLRLVVARCGGSSIALEDAHSHRLPDGLDADDPAAMGEYIAKRIRQHHLRFKAAIVDVPRDRVVINRLALPPTPEPELAAAVRFQAMKELPFPLDEAAVDFVVLQRDDKKLATEVLLAAVHKSALQRIIDTCAAAGLRPARIGLRPYANLVSALHVSNAANSRVLFVDVGPTMTEIDVVRNGVLAFSRSASVAVPLRPAAFFAADESRISAKADTAAVEAGEQAVDASVNELVVELVRTLQAYRATETNAAVDRIVIAGGTGIEAALLEAVGRRFGLPCELFDPTPVLRTPPEDAAKLRSFSAALGLAWGLSTDGLLELDFLNPKKPIPPRAELKRRLRVAGIAAAVLVVGSTAAAATHIYRKTQELDRLRAGNVQLVEKLKAQRALENHVQRVDDWATEAVWPDHLLRIIELLGLPAEGNSIVLDQLRCDEATATISMRLRCVNAAAPTEFVGRLNAFEINGKRPYVATQGVWQTGGTGDPEFSGNVEVTIVLRELQDHRAGAKQREVARKNRLRDL